MSCSECKKSILLGKAQTVDGYYKCPYDKKIHAGNALCDIDERLIYKGVKR